jgi:hypothetical protein
MSIFGLAIETGALIILLQGLSTYAALGSALFFVMPVLRGQGVAASRSILSEVISDGDDHESVFHRADEILRGREIKNHPLGKRDNRIGVVLLIASLAFFTAALVLQLKYDPSFHPGSPVKTSLVAPFAVVA